MKLDDASKVTAMTSTIVAMIVSVAVFMGNREVQKLQKSIQQVDAKTKEIDLAAKSFEAAKQQWVARPRLNVEYEAPLARSFALRMSDDGAGNPLARVMIPTNTLSDELLGSWRERRGLMTGQACQHEGLKARQVALVRIANFGSVSAEDVVLTARRGQPAGATNSGRWNVMATGAPVAYADLEAMSNDWPEIEVAIGTLMESDARGGQVKSVQVVLASVSGSSDLYGAILVPRAVSWTDPIKKERQTLKLGLSYFRSALLGGEIGSLASVCR